jgi:hypothetical protein
MDVTNVSGGATVRCPDCGAMVRVPTGQTGQYPNVKAQVPEPAAAASSKGGTKVRVGGGRQTELFRKMSGTRMPGATGRPPSRSSVEAEGRGAMMPRRRGGGAGLAIGAAVGAVVLIGLLIFMVNNQKDSAAKRKSDLEAKNERIREQNRKTLEEARRQAAEDEAADAKLKEEAKAGKKPALQGGGKGNYVPPAAFEPGARKWGRSEELKVDAGLQKQYESLAQSGNSGEIVKEIAKYMPSLINGLISENEVLARGSFNALIAFYASRNVTTESGKPPVAIELFNSAQWRGGEFDRLYEWFEKPQNKVAIGAGTAKDLEEIKTKGADPASMNWDKLMQDLRPGGGFDNKDRPEGRAYAQIKDLGPAAYPFLVKFIDNEDVMVSRAAVRALNELTGQQRPLPNEATKAATKTEWENYIKK